MDTEGMTGAYSVRPADGGDLASVLAVLAENQSSRPMELPVLPISPSSRQIAMWSRITRSPDVTVYLAEFDGQPVGTACLSILPNITYDCRPTAFIEAVVVRYEHRRRGVARLMLGRALEAARRESCFKVQLLTHKRHANDGAHDLYRSLGFQAEAEGFRLYLRDA
jgi:GNAT superfamily N-acetyltransferase